MSAAPSEPPVVVSLSGIETDTTRPAGWMHRPVAVVCALLFVGLLVRGPAPLGGVTLALVPGKVRPDPFFLWLTLVLGSAVGAAVLTDRWLALHRSRVEIDRAGSEIRVRRGGLWSRRQASLPWDSLAELALSPVQDDDARAWRLEFRARPRSGHPPLHVMTTHHLDRLEPLARRMAQETGLTLRREKPARAPR
jgi:hypothetical protein